MKKQLVVLGAAALIAAAAVPALAFENEFHGMYRLRALLTNFDDAGLVTSGVGTPLLSPSSNFRDFTLFEQRARLQYIAKANDDLKLVTQFEIDSTWGDAAFQNGRGQGAALGADTVNLETKSVYLDFNIPSVPVNMKVGLQPFADAYKGIFFLDDAGGAVATGKFGPLTTTAGYFRTYDKGGTTALGRQTVDVYIADGKFAVGNVLTLGASYYGANNTSLRHTGQMTNTFGVNASAKIAILDLDAFLLYQGGDELYAASARSLQAFAGQVAAKLTVGPIAVRAAGLYASGDDGKNAFHSKAFQNLSDVASGTPGGVAGSSTTSTASLYFSSNMLLLMRSIYAMDSDQALIASANNNNRGLVAAFAGVDAKITDKFSVSGNVGHAMVDRKNDTVLATASTSDKNIGTEINASLNYALYTNLTATLQGAYVFLGGYTKLAVARPFSENVANPYLAGVMLNYTF